MAKKRNLKMWVIMAVFWVAVLGMSCPALAVSWHITQVTNNIYDNYNPQISGSNVVWERHEYEDYPSDGDYEIFFWDGDPTSEPINISNHIYDDYSPQISGSNVVWQGYDGNDYEIFFWDVSMAEPCQVTDNSYDDYSPQISGSNVVWQGYDGNDYEIFFWDVSMAEPCQVTDNSYDDYSPQISGSNVVWRGYDGSDYEIFFWDGTTITRVTDNSYDDYWPRISGSNVVWFGYDGNDYEIFFWDGTTITRVTDNSYDDYWPQISGSNVVWFGYDGNDYEIFFWDGDPTSEPTNISNNSTYDYTPQISGSNVVWYGYEGGSDAEIFFWDGDPTSEPVNISNNSNYYDYNPQISGSNVVWEGGSEDYCEIFMAVPMPTIYVDADVTGGANNGTSWENAYLYLQDALDFAITGDEIWVAAGTYKPDASSSNPGGSGTQTATFQLINGVNIYGGYAGVGAADPNERDVEQYKTLLSGDIGTTVINTDNSYHVVTGSGTDLDAVLDGFTITAGNANGASPYNRGGGMYNDSGSPTVTNCTFSSSSAVNGGGMYNYNSSSPTVTNCTFSGNSANYGGGMYNYQSNPTVANCTFSKNSAAWGGGMRNWQSSPTLISCIFIGNSADWGGGMYNTQSSPTVTNCTFSGNSANYNGGAMRNWQSGSPTLSNCILWGNTSPMGAQIYNDETSSATVSYSDVEGGWSGTGNIDKDPLFIGPNGRDGIGGTADDEDDNVHLSPSGSPCFNAGDPSGDYTGQTDLDRQPRVAYGRVDMGADEVFPIACDFEPDGDVDFADFAIFAGNWLLGAE